MCKFKLIPKFTINLLSYLTMRGRQVLVQFSTCVSVSVAVSLSLGSTVHDNNNFTPMVTL